MCSCGLSEMNLVTTQACELQVSFTVECFQHSLVVLCNMRQGVILNLMVAAVSKPSIQGIQRIPQKRTSYPYMTTAKSAQTYLNGEILPI